MGRSTPRTYGRAPRAEDSRERRGGKPFLTYFPMATGADSTPVENRIFYRERHVDRLISTALPDLVLLANPHRNTGLIA